MAGTDTTPGHVRNDRVIARIETLERKVKELEELINRLRTLGY